MKAVAPKKEERKKGKMKEANNVRGNANLFVVGRGGILVPSNRPRGVKGVCVSFKRNQKSKKRGGGSETRFGESNTLDLKTRSLCTGVSSRKETEHKSRVMNRIGIGESRRAEKNRDNSREGAVGSGNELGPTGHMRQQKEMASLTRTQKEKGGETRGGKDAWQSPFRTKKANWLRVLRNGGGTYRT